MEYILKTNLLTKQFRQQKAVEKPIFSLSNSGSRKRWMEYLCKSSAGRYTD